MYVSEKDSLLNSLIQLSFFEQGNEVTRFNSSYGLVQIWFYFVLI